MKESLVFGRITVVPAAFGTGLQNLRAHATSTG